MPRHVLAREFDCSPTTISRTIKRFRDHNTVASWPRRRRKEKLSPAEARYMVLILKRNPKMSWADLMAQCHVGVSRNTLRKVLAATRTPGPSRKKA